MDRKILDETEGLWEDVRQEVAKMREIVQGLTNQVSMISENKKLMKKDITSLPEDNFLIKAQMNVLKQSQKSDVIISELPMEENEDITKIG